MCWVLSTVHIATVRYTACYVMCAGSFVYNGGIGFYTVICGGEYA